MEEKSIVEMLPFWDSLSEKEKQLVKSRAVIRPYKKGEMIQPTDCNCLGMVLVVSGGIRVYILSEEGREITLYRLTEGECCILSASCVVEEITFDSEMSATEDCRLLVIPTAIFKELMENNIYVRCFIYEALCKRFSSAVWTMQMILFKGYDRRLADFLVSEYDRTGSAEIKMTHEQIARYTNSAREVVARMLKRFASEGLVTFKRGTIQLIDTERLRNL